MFKTTNKYNAFHQKLSRIILIFDRFLLVFHDILTKSQCWKWSDHILQTSVRIKSFRRFVGIKRPWSCAWDINKRVWWVSNLCCSRISTSVLHSALKTQQVFIRRAIGVTLCSLPCYTLLSHVIFHRSVAETMTILCNVIRYASTIYKRRETSVWRIGYKTILCTTLLMPILS